MTGSALKSALSCANQWEVTLMTSEIMKCAVPPSLKKASARDWIGLSFLALPTILLGADLTVLHLALPALAKELNPSSIQALWIMDSYGFMIAGSLVTMGTLGDRIGRRKLLMIGAAAFGSVSVFAAFASTPNTLIVARALLGIAAATLMPSTLALISNMFIQRRDKALAIGVWATMFALGMAVGPLVGGALLQIFSWKAVFFAAVPVVLIVILGAPFLLPEYRARDAQQIDLVSVGLSLAGILPMVYGMKQLAKGQFDLWPLISILLGSFILAIFVRRQKKLQYPLLDTALFERRDFSIALVVLLIAWIAVSGIMLLITQYLQLVIGLSPFQAGLWMGPPALAQVAAGIAAPLLARRVRPGYVAAYALLVSVVGFFVLTFVGHARSDLLLVVVGFSLAYVGLGAIAALGTDLVVSAAPEDKAGSASALSETVQDLGVSLGIAAVGSLSTAMYRSEMLRRLPVDLPADLRTSLSDSLWSAVAMKNLVPIHLLIEARAVFANSFDIAAKLSAIVLLLLSIIVAVTLRNNKSISGVD